ncbi:hypothetical protein RN001_013213 [Aquatica leii]|uniref:FAD dependent oxidoreductase domain-containing protein n=1 Tax=Aquatica leii TaxID=1421715 RepID=A0AAN7SLI1_9COLE|nr:hypothetical protein RN001_013213 [Aquatica leii]
MHNVAIIGCGIIGLTTATVLQNEFKSTMKITIFTEKLTPNTTSDIAAGLWGPYSVLDTKLEKIQKWGKASHDYFLQLWKSGLADEAGITLQHVKALSTSDVTDTADRDKIVFGFEKIPSHEIQKLGAQHNKNYKVGYNYVTFTCEPQIHLPYLQKKFISNGGVIIVRKIDNIHELSDYDLVINCTGLNAKELCNDDQVVPIRGQIAKVRAPWQFHSLFSDSNYTIPNCNHVVVGGTTQLGDWETNPREIDTKNILSGVYNTIPSLQHGPILYHKVGLRPGRSQTRLELEMQKVREKQLPVVHNYGHGGAGVTFSYGCALDALELVKEVIGTSHKSKL